MKKLIITTLLALLLTNFFGKDFTKMPEKMAKSILVLRAGVLDMRKATVEETFLNKEFKVEERLDGTITTFKYGKFKVEGNICSMYVDFYEDDVCEQALVYTFEYLGDTTLFKKVEAIDKISGEVLVCQYTFSDRIQILINFNNLIK